MDGPAVGGRRLWDPPPPPPAPPPAVGHQRTLGRSPSPEHINPANLKPPFSHSMIIKRNALTRGVWGNGGYACCRAGACAAGSPRERVGELRRQTVTHTCIIKSRTPWPPAKVASNLALHVRQRPRVPAGDGRGQGGARPRLPPDYHSFFTKPLK